MNIFAKAQAGANLTPGERAFVKLVKGWLIAGCASALVVLFQLVSTGSINPGRDWRFVAGAFVVAFLIAAEKYFTAQGDTPLATATGDAAVQAQKWAGVSDYGNKPAIAQMQPAAVNSGPPTTVTYSPPPTTTSAAPATVIQ